MASLDGYEPVLGPGVGGYFVEVYGKVCWPWPDENGCLPIKNYEEAKKVAASIPLAKVLRCDIVLRHPPRS